MRGGGGGGGGVLELERFWRGGEEGGGVGVAVVGGGRRGGGGAWGVVLKLERFCRTCQQLMASDVWYNDLGQERKGTYTNPPNPGLLFPTFQTTTSRCYHIPVYVGPPLWRQVQLH